MFRNIRARVLLLTTTLMILKSSIGYSEATGPHEDHLLGNIMKEMSRDFRSVSRTVENGVKDSQSVENGEVFTAILRTKTMRLMVSEILKNVLVEQVSPPGLDELPFEDQRK